MPRQYFVFFCALVAFLFSAACKPNSQSSAPTQQSSSTNSSTPTQAVIEKAIVPITNMVLIKPGAFQRGKFQVTLTREYRIGKYEVTQGEYEALMKTNTSNFPGDRQRPVEKVKFLEAEAYCNALTQRERAAGHLPEPFVYRLPTEAEWEYACRAGSTNLLSFNDPALADEYAWTLDNSDGTTHPVGQKKPNAWGLCDMHGNVWEWCADWFAPYPEKDVQNPLGAMAGKFKVFHGGSWNHQLEFARTSSRFMMEPNQGLHSVGFRVVLSRPLPSPPPQNGPRTSPEPAK